MIGWIQLLDQDLLTTQCKQFTSLCRCKKYLRASVIGSKEKILVYADQYRILLTIDQLNTIIKVCTFHLCKRL